MQLKKDSNLKILKNANYQTEKQLDNIKYPDVYAHRYGYNNSSKINNISSNKRRITSSNSKQMSRTSNDFFERNYNSYLDKIFSKKNFVNSSMISESELNSLLYKLKKYNNEVMTYTSKKEESLKQLKNNLKLIEYKYNKLKELQDIELPDEKISVKNFNELKMSKADIEQKLYIMMQEKQEMDYSLKNEKEYNKTIEYMFEDEQNRLLSIKKETNIIEQKLYNVGKYQKIVSDNITKNDKKNKNFEELNQKIDGDLKLIDDVNNKQNLTNQKLDHEIMMKEKEVQILEEQIRQLKESNSSNINDYKKEIKEEIEQAKEMNKKKIEDEKKYIEIINCLYIIQKYFTEAEDFDKEQLLTSKDYNLLTKMNEEYVSTFTDTKKNITENTTKNNFIKKENNTSKNKRVVNRALSSVKIKRNFMNNTTSRGDEKSMNITRKMNSTSNIKQNKSFKINANKTASTFFNTKTDINTFYNSDKNNIEELIDKFNEIKLTKQILFDYNSSLMSKLNFYRSQLNDFHFKEINLEGTKKAYEEKVNDIISNNYFDFEELTKYNEKCEKFLEDNEYFINKMKKNNNKKKMNKILERINKNEKEESDSEEEKLKKITKEEKKKIDIDDIVFKSSKNIIMSVNNFFLTCTDLIKDIIVSLNNNMNDQNGSNAEKKIVFTKIEEDNSLFMKENNITEEESDNPFIETFKKLAEYQKNKELNISKDYKLLLQYIKSLIHYIEDKPENEFKLDIKDVKTNLLNRFYKEGENQNQKIDKLFVRRFLSKKSPNFNNIFNTFTLLLNPTIDNIKSIYNLINNESNKKYLDDSVKNKVDISQKISSTKKIYQPLTNSENISKNEN